MVRSGLCAIEHLILDTTMALWDKAFRILRKYRVGLGVVMTRVLP